MSQLYGGCHGYIIKMMKYTGKKASKHGAFLCFAIYVCRCLFFACLLFEFSCCNNYTSPPLLLLLLQLLLLLLLLSVHILIIVQFVFGPRSVFYPKYHQQVPSTRGLIVTVMMRKRLIIRTARS